MKINRLSPLEHKYLQILDTIAKKPKALYLMGNLPDSRRPTVAIVGTRKPSAYGKEVTHRLAYELASRGVVVISGLALGVDGIAHRAALEAEGTTIAVLANGLPNIYPASHKSLAADLLEKGGAIISEYEPGSSARGYQFLQRNRIVSGLSDAIIITEAATRSGTLNTAAHALEQGKEVFVVPGNITSPLSGGCNALLKQGATPVTSTEDVLEIIAPDLLQPQAVLPLGNTPLETTIITLLQSGVRDGEALQAQSGATSSEFNQALTMMELSGTVRSLGANQWTLS
ncbi:MAG TPA: DNA-processing protein DprA [Candidatus Saccharimonadales bacterium]